MIRQDFAKWILTDLKEKQDPDAPVVKKSGFVLLDMPSAGIRDALVFLLKEDN